MNGKKAPKETVRVLLTMITEKNAPKKTWVHKEQISLESLWNSAKLKENKFTLQWVRPKLHLLNVQYNAGKLYYTITWEKIDTSTITNWVISLQHCILEKIAR